MIPLRPFVLLPSPVAGVTEKPLCTDEIKCQRILRHPDAPDPLRQAAGVREGAMAVLVGFAACRSVETGKPVDVAGLTSLVPQAVRP